MATKEEMEALEWFLKTHAGVLPKLLPYGRCPSDDFDTSNPAFSSYVGSQGPQCNDGSCSPRADPFELNCNGVAPALRTDTAVGYSSLCISKDITYTFVSDVIREIAAEQRSRGFAGRAAADLRDEDDTRAAEDDDRDRELDVARRGASPGGA